MKYRIWDGLNQRMRYIFEENLTLKIEPVTFENSKKMAWYLYDGEKCIASKDDGVSVLMTSTKEVDRNGMDIYEGDLICLVKNRPVILGNEILPAGETVEVKFVDGIFTIPRLSIFDDKIYSDELIIVGNKFLKSRC